MLALALTGSSVTFLAIGYLAAGARRAGRLRRSCFVRVLRERGLLQHLRPRRIVLPFRAVFSFSLPLITGELLLLSLNVGGVLILGYFHSAAEVASYRAVFNPARLNTAVLHAFVPMFLPLAARLFAREDIDGLRRAYWHTGAFVAVLTFPIFALTGPLAPSSRFCCSGRATPTPGSSSPCCRSATTSASCSASTPTRCRSASASGSSSASTCSSRCSTSG